MNDTDKLGPAVAMAMPAEEAGYAPQRQAVPAAERDVPREAGLMVRVASGISSQNEPVIVLGFRCLHGEHSLPLTIPHAVPLLLDLVDAMGGAYMQAQLMAYFLEVEQLSPNDALQRVIQIVSWRPEQGEARPPQEGHDAATGA